MKHQGKTAGKRAGMAAWLLSSLLAWAAPAGAVFAQDEQPSPAAVNPEKAVRPGDDSSTAAQLNTVEVTGHAKYDKRQLEQTIIPQFIRSHGAMTKIGQLARWQQEICPKTDGLSASSNDFISGRIREIAKRVGAPVKDSCETNVHVIFAADPQKLLDQYAQHASSVFGYHYSAETRDLATMHRPIEAWYATATRGARGLPEVDSTAGTANSNMSLLSAGSGPAGTLGSRLTNELSSEFFNVLVVVDVKKVIGYELGPISDYIAMLALSQPQSLEECSELPSILDLWTPACASRPNPTALTVADTAYLKALYDINMQAIASFERTEISARMQRDIEGR